MVDDGFVPRLSWPEVQPSTARGDRGELTIKQSLYDWLPPAYGHPSPGHSETPPRPHDVGGAIGWVASNYRGQHAGSITWIEPLGAVIARLP